MPPTRAARWMTTCAPSRAARHASWSRRSYSLERDTRTSAPSSSSSATVGRPRKPAPPVTTTCLPDQKPGSGVALATARRLAALAAREPEAEAGAGVEVAARALAEVEVVDTEVRADVAQRGGRM